jgi:hypothetical protein
MYTIHIHILKIPAMSMSGPCMMYLKNKWYECMMCFNTWF